MQNGAGEKKQHQHQSIKSIPVQRGSSGTTVLADSGCSPLSLYACEFCVYTCLNVFSCTCTYVCVCGVWKTVSGAPSKGGLLGQTQCLTQAWLACEWQEPVCPHLSSAGRTSPRACRVEKGTLLTETDFSHPRHHHHFLLMLGVRKILRTKLNK